MRFSQLEGTRIGVWGAGREIASFAAQRARRLPAARIAVAAFDAPPGADAHARLHAPDARVVSVEADGAETVIEALRGCDVLVRSPGVSVYRRELVALAEAGVPVTTATALWLGEQGGAGVIGVTGTKGKSTTASIAHHLACAAGRDAVLAGNIGVPALDLLDRDHAEVTVLELSSYQLADLADGPEVALVTNLYREHTDWHGSEEAYRADKLRILTLPGVRAAVVNARDEALSAAARELEARGADVDVVRYGAGDGWDVVDSTLRHDGMAICAGDALALRGEHNALNLCGALSALEALGVAPPPLPRSLAGLQALAHRLETVAEHDGVTWVNDSISTTPESTLAALASFPGAQIVLIAGGQDRGQDYARLARVLADGEATLIGVPSTGARLVGAARDAGAPAERAIDAPGLPEAVNIAATLARPGSVVLLSPAAPSYDNYRDFEERGERFKALARSSQPHRT